MKRQKFYTQKEDPGIYTAIQFFSVDPQKSSEAAKLLFKSHPLQQKIGRWEKEKKSVLKNLASLQSLVSRFFVRVQQKHEDLHGSHASHAHTNGLFEEDMTRGVRNNQSDGFKLR